MVNESLAAAVAVPTALARELRVDTNSPMRSGAPRYWDGADDMFEFSRRTSESCGEL